MMRTSEPPHQFDRSALWGGQPGQLSNVAALAHARPNDL